VCGIAGDRDVWRRTALGYAERMMRTHAEDPRPGPTPDEPNPPSPPHPDPPEPTA